MARRTHFVLSAGGAGAGPGAKKPPKVQPVDAGKLALLMTHLQGGEIDKVYKYLPRAILAAWQRRKTMEQP